MYGCFAIIICVLPACLVPTEAIECVGDPGTDVIKQFVQQQGCWGLNQDHLEKNSSYS